jgi:HPt (histidine-containing phosphotransfer) domain-containing protein
VETVLATFRTESIETLGALVRGLKEGGGESAIRSAHSLKGMAATVCADELSRAAAALEALGRAGDWDAAKRQVEVLQHELDGCLASISPRAELENKQRSTAASNH